MGAFPRYRKSGSKTKALLKSSPLASNSSPVVKRGASPPPVPKPAPAEASASNGCSVTDFLSLSLAYSGRFVVQMLLGFIILGCLIVAVAAQQPTVWPWTILNHLWLQYTLVLVVLAPLLLVSRQWVPAIAVVACLLLFCVPKLAPYFPAMPGFSEPKAEANSAVAAIAPDDKIRFLQFNLWIHSRNKQAAEERILTSDADIISLNEVVDTWPGFLEGSKILRKYPYQIRYTTDIWLLSKWPIKTYQRHIQLYPHLDPSIDNWVDAEIEAPNGRTLHVLGVHTQTPMTEPGQNRLQTQLSQVAEVAAQRSAEGHGVIVVGDLNAAPWVPEFKQLLKAGNLTNPRQELNKLAPTWGPVWRVWPLSLPIDHILPNDQLQTRYLTVMEDGGSDHRPYLMELGWKQNTSESKD